MCKHKKEFSVYIQNDIDFRKPRQFVGACIFFLQLLIHIEATRGRRFPVEIRGRRTSTILAILGLWQLERDVTNKYQKCLFEKSRAARASVPTSASHAIFFLFLSFVHSSIWSFDLAHSSLSHFYSLHFYYYSIFFYNSRYFYMQ